MYVANQQFTPDNYTIPKLDQEGIWRVQGIVGALLYYARETDNKFLMALRAIDTRQASNTKRTAASIHQLLDYIATYPNNGIIYSASDMILCAHSKAAYLNEPKACSRAGSFIVLFEYDTIPRLNGPVLKLA